MGTKLAMVFGTLCLVYFLVEGSIIKPNNVPRMGRSNEADGPYDPYSVGYVIKTIPSKNIPRMGRRNFDSENRYDIPKLHQLSTENLFGDEEQIEAYYGNQFENMMR